uniref:RRM domain-containing protein n=1 Tax=Anopheles maculatus TaxID=74869 RepID=A0A182T0Q8_9DIPT
MSSGESSGDSSEPTNASATPSMSSREAAANVMLTDSENTNNENRVIEMESNPVTEEDPEGGVTPPTPGDVEQPRIRVSPKRNGLMNLGRKNKHLTIRALPATSGDVEQVDEPTTAPDTSVPEEKRVDESGKEKQAPDDTGTSTAGKDQYAEHVTYNEAGEAIYTDPATKFQYRWCKEKSEWVPRDGKAPAGAAGETPSDNPYENEHYRWCHEKKEWIPKQENPTETEFYRWDKETQKWVAKEQQQQQQKPPSEEESAQDRQYGYEDGVHTYKDKDGAVYFWDDERKAWFPKVDDDFMAMYQLNYGFIDNTSAGSVAAATPRVTPGVGPTTAAREFPGRNVVDAADDDDDEAAEQRDEAQRAAAKGKKRKAPPEPPKWFDLAPEQNAKVYVSNLPTDISEEEFGEVMSKCGMVMKDPKTHKLKLKLY